MIFKELLLLQTKKMIETAISNRRLGLIRLDFVNT